MLTKVQVKRRDEHDNTPLHLEQDVGRIKLLLQSGADVEAENEDNLRPLHLAVRRNNMLAVEVLLGAGAEVSVQDNLGYTPLHYAVLQSNHDITKALLEKGAMLEITNIYNETPILCSSMNNHDTILKKLLEAGADCEAKDVYGRTLLHIAAADSNYRHVETLLSAGANVNARDAMNKTPLHNALTQDSKIVVEMLLKAGADVNAKDLLGFTPLHSAMTRGCIDTVKMLLKMGASVNAKNTDGSTPLHRLYISQTFDVVDITLELLARGASFDIVDHNGRTPLDFGVSITFNHLNRFLIKLQCANLIVRLEPMKDEMEDFCVLCTREIEKIKLKKRGNSSLYDVFSKRKYSNCMFVINDWLTQTINSSSLHQEFPLYALLLKVKFKNAKRRYKLLKSAEESFNCHIGLPSEVKSEILSYVSCDDLKCLIEAFSEDKKE